MKITPANIWMLHFQVSPVEAEEENQKDEVVSAPVDSERSDLKDGVKEQEELLCDAPRECECKSKVREKSLTLNTTE